MSDKQYMEVSKFRDKWLFGLIGLAIFIDLANLGQNLITSTFSKTATYLILLAVLLCILYFLTKLKMKVSINENRIKYSVFPLHEKSKRISWTNVDHCELVKTPKHAQWHGSNISFFREKLYSLNGRNGLSLTMKDGKRYFIGIRDVDSLSEFLKSKFSI